MNTAERLRHYYDFSPDVLESVQEAADRQNRFSFRSLAQQFGIENGADVVLPEAARKPIEVLTLTPEAEYDPRQARVYHTAFGYPVNKNTALHAMRLFEADSSQQLIVMGNPSSIGSGANKLTIGQSMKLFRSKSFEATVETPLRYLEQRNITDTSHLGYSYGADRAAVASARSELYNQQVSRAVLVEPVTVVKRSIQGLVADFASTRHAQQDYVRQTESKPYDEVWAEDSVVKFASYAAGLMRLSNIAIANVLRANNFESRVACLLDGVPEAHIAIGWGTSSEISPDDAMQEITDNLSAQYGNDRITSIRIIGMHHAGVDDLDLHAAIMLQGLRV